MEDEMAFDGAVISCLVHELKTRLAGGRIVKVAQPEKDELVLTIKNYDQYKLYISASAGLPLIYLTETSKPNPVTAPNFCMLLRKHLNSARIIDIVQPELERIINIKIEHLDDLGDLCRKTLVVEIMGKHSNIIFIDDNSRIVDSIKHVSGFVSSVREVLPGREYFIPKTSEKLNPLATCFDDFKAQVLTRPMSISKALYTVYTGISPLLANEICCRASLDSDAAAQSITEDVGMHLFKNFERVMDLINKKEYTPNIVYRGREPVEFSCIPLTCYETSGREEAPVTVKPFDSMSTVLETYYSAKNAVSRIRQKSSDLRKIVGTAIERESKKLDLQQKQLKDTEKREKYKVYGELITTYGYNVEPGAKSFSALNYYTNEEITIPLDPMLSAMENAKKYFEKYSKQKRTFEALSKYIVETQDALAHLESIRTSLDIARREEDLVQLKDELTEYGYIKKHYTRQMPGQKKVKKVKITSRPFHYVSSDGFHMYVGKNNYQNDELTFEFANGNDWWFHAKGIPGSHVIVKTEGKELPDRVFEEAGRLAAFYSKGRDSDKVEIDYLEKKNVKKPNGAKPGFVVYYTNYSLVASPDITGITEIEERTN